MSVLAVLLLLQSARPQVLVQTDFRGAHDTFVLTEQDRHNVPEACRAYLHRQGLSGHPGYHSLVAQVSQNLPPIRPTGCL